MLICDCGTRLRCIRTGFPVVQLTAELQPKAVYSGDAYTCGPCNKSVVTNIAPQPFAQWNDQTWSDTLAHIKTQDHIDSVF